MHISHAVVTSGRVEMASPPKEPLRAMSAAEPATRGRLTHASSARAARGQRAGSARVDQARRARALRTVAAGQSFAQAARQAGFRSGTAVANLVARFNRHGLTAVVIAPGRGRRPT